MVDFFVGKKIIRKAILRFRSRYNDDSENEDNEQADEYGLEDY